MQWDHASTRAPHAQRGRQVSPKSGGSRAMPTARFIGVERAGPEVPDRSEEQFSDRSDPGTARF